MFHGITPSSHGQKIYIHNDYIIIVITFYCFFFFGVMQFDCSCRLLNYNKNKSVNKFTLKEVI